jgi:Type II secretion system (T2SS), protein M subtype b
MNNFLTKLSRRERLYVLLAAVALFAGVVVYPLSRLSESYRESRLEELEAARSLRESYQTMLRTADQIKTENSELKEALSQTSGLLFDRTGNDVMMEAAVVKILNKMAPDLSLDVSMAKSSLRGVPGQLNFTVRGSGRYPEILNFFYQIENNRPLIVIDQFSISSQGGRRGAVAQKPTAGKPPQSSKSKMAETGLSEPRMRLQMEIHINCRTVAKGSGK